MPADSSRLFQQSHPRVVATISSTAGWEMACKIDPDAADAPDLFEVRADLLLQSAAELPDEIGRLPLPAILTVRGPDEGGIGAPEGAARARVYRHYLAEAAAIDVELATANELSALISDARAQNVACIFSYHNFADTPDLATLTALAAQAKNLGADLFKVAVTTHSVTQLCTLLTWLEQEKHQPTSVMGMGTLGKISRPLLAQLGSQLNYGYLDAPVVSGQWPATELQRVIRALLL